MTYTQRHPLLVRSFTIFIMFSTLACATSRPSDPEHSVDSASIIRDPASDSISGIPKESIETIREIEKEILQANAEIEKPESSSEKNPAQTPSSSLRSKIPLEINENVMKWIHYFTVTDRDRFHRFLKRGSVYKSLVQDILRKNGVPTELYYLAMIESGYVTHAKSHASAVGIWQFIRGTGLRYGLKQNFYIDERRDIVRSTEAAAKYLRNLHTAFQSWYLAMAGYNAGEGRILGAIMRGSTRDFWDLVEKKALPPETRNYVPKFLAATIIGKHPEKYGFTDIASPKFPEVKAVELPGGLSLNTISREVGVPLSTLKTLNPHLLRASTPRGFQQYSVWVPQESSINISLVQRQLAGLKTPVKNIPQTQQPKLVQRYHLVRRGENLNLIAKHYELSVHSLKRLNRLSSNRVFAGKRLLVSSPTKEQKTIAHRVREGEGLALIAARYQVPMKRIKRINDLRTNRIYVGQRLIIAKGI